MALRKKEGADLSSQHPLYAEIGLVLSLALLIVAFRVDVSAQSGFEVPMDEQLVDIKEIQPTGFRPLTGGPFWTANFRGPVREDVFTLV